jgi:hypothetical protein
MTGCCHVYHACPCSLSSRASKHKFGPRRGTHVQGQLTPTIRFNEPLILTKVLLQALDDLIPICADDVPTSLSPDDEVRCYV